MTMLEFVTYRQPVARKEYVCDLCNGKIMVGEKHVYQAGKFDGEFFSVRLHRACNAVIDEYCRDTGYGEYDEDAIEDWWRAYKCDGCKHYYQESCDCRECNNPAINTGKLQDKSCRSYYKGKRRQGETCDVMDKGCWCTKYEPEVE